MRRLAEFLLLSFKDNGDQCLYRIPLEFFGMSHHLFGFQIRALNAQVYGAEK
jgi:hypothetical protein